MLPKRLFHDFNIPRNDAGYFEVMLDSDDVDVPHVGDIVLVGDSELEIIGRCRGVFVIIEEVETKDAN